MSNNNDLISFENGWQLLSLHRTPKEWRAVIEKEVQMVFHPHYCTRYKVGTGKTQREALTAAMKAKGYAWPEVALGTRSAS